MDVRESILEMLRERARAARLEEDAKEHRLKARELEVKIFEWLQEQGLEKTAIPEGPSVSMNPIPRVTVTDEHLESWTAFLKGHGYASLFKTQIHYKSQEAAVKELIARGEGLPNYVKIYEQPSLNIRANGYAEVIA